MRDKIMRFMSLTGSEEAIAKTIDSLVGQFRENFEQGFGETLPQNAVDALAVVKRTLAERSATLRDALADVYAKRFTEAEIDALVAFYQTDVGKKLTAEGMAAQEEIAHASNAWTNAALRAVEPDLARLLG